jgi:hypothetical protein
LIFPLIAAIAETGTRGWAIVLTIAKAGHAALLLTVLPPAGGFFGAPASSTSRLFGNGSSGVATRSVEVLVLPFIAVELLTCKAASQGLRFVEAVVGVVVSTAHPWGLSPCGRFVIEIGRAACLFG